MMLMILKFNLAKNGLMVGCCDDADDDVDCCDHEDDDFGDEYDAQDYVDESNLFLDVCIRTYTMGRAIDCRYQEVDKEGEYDDDFSLCLQCMS